VFKKDNLWFWEMLLSTFLMLAICTVGMMMGFEHNKERMAREWPKHNPTLVPLLGQP
jgi:hypothetical protein